MWERGGGCASERSWFCCWALLLLLFLAFSSELSPLRLSCLIHCSLSVSSNFSRFAFPQEGKCGWLTHKGLGPVEKFVELYHHRCGLWCPNKRRRVSAAEKSCNSIIFEGGEEEAEEEEKPGRDQEYKEYEEHGEDGGDLFFF